jgi:hypothetical protein
MEASFGAIALVLLFQQATERLPIRLVLRLVLKIPMPRNLLFLCGDKE